MHWESGHGYAGVVVVQLRFASGAVLLVIVGLVNGLVEGSTFQMPETQQMESRCLKQLCDTDA